MAEKQSLVGRSTRLFAAAMLAALLILVPVSLSLGYTGLRSPLVFDEIGVLRLYRTLVAFCVGSLLGLAGTLLQYSLSNPLASPSVLGLSSGAMLAAEVAMLVYRGSPPVGLTVLAGTLGSLAAYALTVSVAARAGFTRTSLVLSGLAVAGSLAGLASLLSLVLTSKYSVFVGWLLTGSVAYASKAEALAGVAALIPIAVLSMPFSRGLDAMSYGDEVALSLGFHPSRLRLAATLLASISTSLTVYLAGIVGFVGLIAPNIARSGGAVQPWRAIPLSMAAGSLVVLAADVGGRAVAIGLSLGEVPVGLITSAAGGLFLAYMLVKVKGA
ncbi:MAG: iron ABC transporter permease [Thermoproteota archaeon]